MRKGISALLCAVCALICTSALVLSACDKGGGGNDKPLNELQASSYEDYASKVYLNTEKYPELRRQGLSLVTAYDEDDYDVSYQVEADSEQNIRDHFDPQKNVLIIINGLQIGNGRSGNVSMASENRMAELMNLGDEGEAEYFSSDPKSAQAYDLGKYWLDNGYNVFYFHYEQFADHVNSEGETDAIESPFAVCDRIWSRDNGVQAVLPDNTLTVPGEAINGYSVAELFVAEYLRTMLAVDKLYPDYKNADRDIRCAGHSMGGVLTVAGNVLLKLVAENGAIDKNLTPNRLELMDSYVGLGGRGTIAWSGKPYVGGNTGENYVKALEMLTVDFGVAAIFYTNKGYVVPFQLMVSWDDNSHRFQGGSLLGDYVSLANRIVNLAPVVVIAPVFAGVGANYMLEGHNPIREWVLTSILYDAPQVTADGKNLTVPTAAMSDADAIAARGTFWDMKPAEVETVRCDDDVFVTDVYVPET